MENKEYRAILIDATNRTVESVTIQKSDSLKTLQKLVDGYIAPGAYLPNGDIVYVNDEGLLGEPEHFFMIGGAHQPFAVNGVVVSGEEYEDVASKVQDIKARVQFLNMNDLEDIA